MPKKQTTSTKKKGGTKPRARAAKKSVAPKPAQLLLAAPKPVPFSARARASIAARQVAFSRAWTDASARVARDARSAWSATRTFRRRAAELAGGTVAAAAILLIGFFAYSTAVSGRILPHTEVAGVQLGLLTPEQAIERLKGEITALEVDGIPYIVDDTAPGETALRLKPGSDLGVTFQPELAVARLYEDGRTGGFRDQQLQRLRALATTGSIPLPMRFEEDMVTARLRGRIPVLTAQPTEPVIAWDGKRFAVTPGAGARSARIGDVLAATRRNLEALSTDSVVVTLSDQEPLVTDEAARRAADRATALLAKPVRLTYAEGGRGGPWAIDMKKDPTWLSFPIVDGAQRVELDPVRLRTYLADTVAVAIDQAKSDARVLKTTDDSWRVTVEGEAQDGHALRQDEAIAKVQAALAAADPAAEADALAVDLPVSFERGTVRNESGEDMGLRDMLAHAQSSFAASPAGRDFNVRKGMRIYNGILIPKGETFAFNSFLGPIDGRHGWKDALTIFNGGAETRMEPGGGICQVSTTVYQAAVLSGLEVLQRRPHSYFVSYYAKAPGMNGIDATIYPGSQDLVFKNDTPGPILMLAGARGSIAYVQLFGTKDRQVKLQGPMRYGSSSAPTEFEVDPTLPPGSTVVTSSGHAGFSVRWNQTIVFEDGTEKKNVINSVYRAIPGKARVAPTTVAATN